jgi:predicted enzyme related to lactoylglutathione lyase
MRVNLEDANSERVMSNTGLHGFIIDCQTDDIDGAAQFWSEALRLPLNPTAYPAQANYRYLAAGPGGLDIEVQRVDHPSRVHLDIQAEDVAAEVQRLQGLGATIFQEMKDWVVMEAPTGHRFCVVPAKGRPLPK